jgi:glutamine amidotransferase-like uncharacterized protein
MHDKAPTQHTKDVAIALYSDVGVQKDFGTWDESCIAAEKMFQWMGYTVTAVDGDYIDENGLGGFDVLCVPGGNMYEYAQDISSEGKEKIREFVRHGGAYIGICGGAYFAAERVVWQGNQLPMESLELFKGSAEGPFNEIVAFPDYTVCKVNIVDASHPITKFFPDSCWVLYYWGPALLPEEDSGVSILGRYDVTGHPAILAFEYGSGRVFLIGTHPEIEEDSNRDGVEFAEELDDRGSDWELMRSATLWCLNRRHSIYGPALLLR